MKVKIRGLQHLHVFGNQNTLQIRMEVDQLPGLINEDQVLDREDQADSQSRQKEQVLKSTLTKCTSAHEFDAREKDPSCADNGG